MKKLLAVTVAVIMSCSLLYSQTNKKTGRVLDNEKKSDIETVGGNDEIVGSPKKIEKTRWFYGGVGVGANCIMPKVSISKKFKDDNSKYDASTGFSGSIRAFMGARTKNQRWHINLGLEYAIPAKGDVTYKTGHDFTGKYTYNMFSVDISGKYAFYKDYKKIAYIKAGMIFGSYKLKDEIEKEKNYWIEKIIDGSGNVGFVAGCGMQWKHWLVELDYKMASFSSDENEKKDIPYSSDGHVNIFGLSAAYIF